MRRFLRNVRTVAGPPDRMFGFGFDEPSRLPGGSGDATLMTRYVEALRVSPSLEQPMRDLRVWVAKHAKGG